MDTRRSKQIKPEDVHTVGKISVDSRGRNVWQWNDDQLDSTTIMLQKLDNSSLSLAPTMQVRRPEPGSLDRNAPKKPTTRSRRPSDEELDLSVEQTFNVKIGGGFDPYNSSG